MQKSSRIARYLLALAISGLVLVAVGCSENSPVAPQAESPGLVSPNFVQVVNPPTPTALIGDDGPVGPGPVRKLINAEQGGVVNAGRYTLKVPPMALSEDAEFVVYEISPDLVMCDLEPHGIQFNIEVQLIIDLTGTTAEGAADQVMCLYYDEASGWWEWIPGEPYLAEDDFPNPDATLHPNKFVAYLSHFSRYALAN